ncbi:hypothetical protein IFM89_016191 [Coptis chinensis]|uniref:PdxS/SNZ N-terminal domain-containing protein n=1 Tax=Coptis chinensis TaxID=261450 RepID=A0A835J0K2_9MAGN|nr:hypothetical protein IFM89_016191 [Coptis chinensis]
MDEEYNVIVLGTCLKECILSGLLFVDGLKEIKRVVSVLVMAKARVGHFVEAQILEVIGVEYIDESEVLPCSDEENYINKHKFSVPFVSGCRGIGEALSRVREGATLIRIQREVSRIDNIVEMVRNVRSVMGDIKALSYMDDDELFAFAKRIFAPYDLVAQMKQMGRLPIVLFAAGGIATPANAALMMQLGCDGVFLGYEVFEWFDPCKRVRAIVRAVMHYNDAHVLAETSCGLVDSMERLNLNEDRGEQSGSEGVD